MPGQNRREKPRFDARMFAELFQLPLKESKGRAIVVDISLTGIAVDTEADLDVGNEMDCHIEVPIRIKAKVVRRITSGQIKRYGLRFIGQSFLDKIIMRKLLKGSRTTKKI